MVFFCKTKTFGKNLHQAKNKIFFLLIFQIFSTLLNSFVMEENNLCFSFHLYFRRRIFHQMQAMKVDLHQRHDDQMQWFQSFKQYCIHLNADYVN